MLFDMKQNVLQGLLTQKKLLTLGWERAILTCPKQRLVSLLGFFVKFTTFQGTPQPLYLTRKDFCQTTGL